MKKSARVITTGLTLFWGWYLITPLDTFWATINDRYLAILFLIIAGANIVILLIHTLKHVSVIEAIDVATFLTWVSLLANELWFSQSFVTRPLISLIGSVFLYIGIGVSGYLFYGYLGFDDEKKP